MLEGHLFTPYIAGGSASTPEGKIWAIAAKNNKRNSTKVYKVNGKRVSQALYRLYVDLHNEARKEGIYLFEKEGAFEYVASIKGKPLAFHIRLDDSSALNASIDGVNVIRNYGGIKRLLNAFKTS